MRRNNTKTYQKKVNKLISNEISTKNHANKDLVSLICSYISCINCNLLFKALGNKDVFCSECTKNKYYCVMCNEVKNRDMNNYQCTICEDWCCIECYELYDHEWFDKPGFTHCEICGDVYDCCNQCLTVFGLDDLIYCDECSEYYCRECFKNMQYNYCIDCKTINCCQYEYEYECIHNNKISDFNDIREILVENGHILSDEIIDKNSKLIDWP